MRGSRGKLACARSCRAWRKPSAPTWSPTSRSPLAPYGPLPRGEERPLYQLVNRFALPASRWTREGEFFHIRSSTWYDDRMAEIPERVADRWAAQCRRSPRWSLPEAAALLMSLRDEQLPNLTAMLRERGIWLGPPFEYAILEAGMESRGRRPMLRAFGSLPPGPRSALLAGRRLACASLSVDTRRWLRLALRGRAHSEPATLPPPNPDEALLSVALQPLERRVQPQPHSFLVSYVPSGGPDDLANGMDWVRVLIRAGNRAANRSARLSPTGGESSGITGNPT